MSKNLNITAVYIKLGKSIKINRLKCGLTLEQLAYEIGVQKSDIFSIEKGRNITTLTLIKIATVLNIHLKDLFDFNYNVTLNDIDKIVQKKQKKGKKKIKKLCEKYKIINNKNIFTSKSGSNSTKLKSNYYFACGSNLYVSRKYSSTA